MGDFNGDRLPPLKLMVSTWASTSPAVLAADPDHEGNATRSESRWKTRMRVLIWICRRIEHKRHGSTLVQALRDCNAEWKAEGRKHAECHRKGQVTDYFKLLCRRDGPFSVWYKNTMTAVLAEKKASVSARKKRRLTGPPSEAVENAIYEAGWESEGDKVVAL